MKYENPDSTIGKCYCCGTTIRLIPKNYECGHIRSIKNGGTDEISNLRPICFGCNRSMGTTHMKYYMAKYGYDKINQECFQTL